MSEGQRRDLQEATDLLATALVDLDFLSPSRRLAQARTRLLAALARLQELEEGERGG